MRNALALLVGALALNACGDEDDRAAPDTQIDIKPNTLTNQKASFQFHAIGNFSEFLCSFDGEEPASCISPLERDLADGDHTFAVAARLLDSIDLTPASAQWKLDTVAPETSLGTVPPDPDNNATPSIAFAGTDDQGAVTFECAVDGAAPAACVSPFGVSVADGNHTFTVAAVDGAGNRDASPATYGWNVNTTAPQTTIIAGPAAASITAAQVSFAFSSPDAAATFECSIDGGAFAACTSPVALSLADGAHTFSVRAVGFGGTDPSPESVTWTVDAVAPTATITVKPNNPSNDTTPAFQFTATEISTFECQIDGLTTFAACASPFESPSLVDGSTTFRVRATDELGNVGADATFTWVVDTAAPTVTINTQPPANTNDNTPTVTFTPAGGPTLVECAIDGGTFATCTSPFNGAAVPDGPHTISVRVTDAATNSSTATTGTFTVDTVIPTVSIDTEPSPNSNDTTPTIVFSTTDNPTVIQCKVDNGTFAACTSPFTTTVSATSHTITVRVADAATNSSTDVTASFIVDTTPPTIVINSQPLALSNDNTPTVTFTPGGSPNKIECELDGGAFADCTSPFTTTVLDGNHTITVRVTDLATNSASASTSSFKVDTVTPTVTITTEPSPDSNDTTPTIAFSTTDNPTQIQCQVDTGSFASCASPATLTVIEGIHTITVRVSDGVNSSTATTAPFTVDLTPPTVAINTQPAALSNDNTPTVTFTAGGSPTTIECRVDTGTFSSCTGGTFTPTVTDGTHTITVHVVDGAGLQASATTNSFTVDTVKPVVTFDDAPPAQWPVNYFDMKFHANETATLKCSLDGAAFTTCTSPLTITTSYNQLSSFSVQATDSAGNPATATTQWTSVDGLVLHYAYEQGGTTNSSLLEQNTAYSPAGDVTTLPFVGGWAGTAAGFGVQKHTYKNTRRVLTSSAQPGNYTASFWIRTNIDLGNGILFSNESTTGGLTVSIQGNSVKVVVRQGAQTFQQQVTIAMNRWTQIALRTTGPTKKVQIFLDGGLAAVVDVPSATGFEATQSNDLTVGQVTGLDFDDLRFFNRALSDTEMCTFLARGSTNPNNGCVPLSPGIELDFENNTLKDTGAWQLFLVQPQLVQFVNNTKTGGSMFLRETASWGYLQGGFHANVNAVAGHSFSLWFDAAANSSNLIDFRNAGCAPNFGFTCGIAVNYDAINHKLNVFVGTDTGVQGTTSIPIASGRRGIVVTEQRNASQTTSITIYVDGKVASVFPVANGNVYEDVSDAVILVPQANVTVDEIEFWTKDLSSDNEVLCENGFDGLFDPADGSCLMTSN